MQKIKNLIIAAVLFTLLVWWAGVDAQERLKAIAKKLSFPSVRVIDSQRKNETIDFMGARLKNLQTVGEQSATGMDRIRGVLVMSVAGGSARSKILQANDVILALNKGRLTT